jgi:hypothetical protein
MNIVKQLNQFNENSIYFCQPIKNNIIDNGVFIRLLYKINTFVLNGVYLLLPLKDVRIEKYYNKQKYIFDITKNKDIIDKVKEIEETILKRASIRNKTPLYKISENITHGNLKIINYNTQSPLNNTNSCVNNSTVNNYINKEQSTKQFVQLSQQYYQYQVPQIQTPKILQTEQNSDITNINNDIYVILKISGIWENENCYGLTFKCAKIIEEL